MCRLVFVFGMLVNRLCRFRIVVIVVMMVVMNMIGLCYRLWGLSLVMLVWIVVV